MVDVDDRVVPCHHKGRWYTCGVCVAEAEAAAEDREADPDGEDDR